MKPTGIPVFPQNGPPCVTPAYVTPSSTPSPISPGCRGPLHCQLPPQGVSSQAIALSSFKETTVHPCAFLDHSSELEKNGIGLLQSIAHSRPLKSFHKKRSAGEHSNHSALTRPCSHLHQERGSFPGSVWLPELLIWWRVSSSTRLAGYCPSFSAERDSKSKKIPPLWTNWYGWPRSDWQCPESDKHHTSPGLRQP